MKVALTEEFLDEMAAVPKPIGKRCRDEIRNLLRSKGTTGLRLERLTNSPLSRIRIGDYRILLRIDGQTCLLSGVDNRGSVYSRLDRNDSAAASCEVVPSRALTRTANGPSGWDLDKIIARLNEQNQRASYGAIAGFLGGAETPRYLMKDRPRNRMNSWVVAVSTGT
jgi:mRNA-degrading endonuclease RelE of RelBE toxin-antitoxin system